MVDEYADWLDGIAGRLDFGRWFLGHHHTDADIGEFRAVYEDVVPAADGRLEPILSEYRKE